jgi:peptidoglycan endopeptidase LytE
LKITSFPTWKIPLSLLLSIVFLCAGADAYAVRRHVIRDGDTLSAIARRYRVSVGSIMRLNKVNARRLRPGSKIVIPSGDGTAAVEIRRNAETEEITSDKIPAPGLYGNGDLKSVRQTASDLYHLVKKGDTLSSVAREYSVTIADLKHLNGLRTSKLRTGQKLFIRPPGSTVCTVENGDGLREMAGNFNTGADDRVDPDGMKAGESKDGLKLHVLETDDGFSVGACAGASGKNIGAGDGGFLHPREAAGESPSGRLVAFARKLLNVPYKFGGNSLLGIDCSAYVKKVYGLLGIDLPRTTREQFNAGEPIDRDGLSVGDLVFFRTYSSFPSHVGIYIGNNLFVHASSKGRKVMVSNLDTPYFIKRFIGAKRLLTKGLMDGLSDSVAPAEGVR